MSLSCIVMKPRVLDLAKYAHSRDCLGLNFGNDNYQWTVKQGWPTPETTNGFLSYCFWLLSGKDWTKEFKKKSYRE